MGYEVKRFTHEIDEEFVCSICELILKDPVQSPCEHLFCNECIRGWLAFDESCPVERGPLKLEDLKPALRTVRNLVNKFKIKCDFEWEGCGEIIKLQDLKDHVDHCEYNPNGKVICDKGCNIKMDRHEYETKNCISHLADQAVSEQETILKFNEDETSKLGSETSNESEVLVNERPEFRVMWGNGKMSFDQNVLKFDKGCGCAQLIKPLEPTKFSFKCGIVCLGESILIGLARGAVPTVGDCYTSDRDLCFNEKTEKRGSAWKIGDIIECGINFPSDFVNDGRDVRVYFNRNGELMGEELVTMPIDGLFPTVCMFGGAKIKCLSN